MWNTLVGKLCVWALCWVVNSTETCRSHSFRHSWWTHSTGAGNTALNTRRLLRAELGWDIQGIYIVMRARKEPALRGGKALALHAQLLSLGLLKVNKSQFPTGWGESRLAQLYCSKKLKVLGGGDARMFFLPLGAEHLAWEVMNGVWRKWDHLGLSCLRCCGKPPTAGVFESLTPPSTFAGPHPVSQHHAS